LNNNTGRPDLFLVPSNGDFHAIDVGGTRDILNIDYQKMHGTFLDYKYNY
jgi:hypothetical protein